MNMSHPPGQILRDMVSADIHGELLGAKGVEELPEMTGAYVLILHLAHLVTLNRPRDTIIPLPPGWYIYAGSERGPGDIRARLARHFRAEKRTR